MNIKFKLVDNNYILLVYLDNILINKYTIYFYNSDHSDKDFVLVEFEKDDFSNAEYLIYILCTYYNYKVTIYNCDLCISKSILNKILNN